MQKMTISLLKYTLLISFLVTLYSCGSSDPIIKKNRIKTGTFDYTLTDSTGLMLTTGKINLDYAKGGDISGTYTVIKDTATKFDGQSTMKDGPFSGNYNDSLSMVFFNLNPRMADANIFISAKDHGDSLRGDWYYSTLRGKTSAGFFRATRIK